MKPWYLSKSVWLGILGVGSVVVHALFNGPDGALNLAASWQSLDLEKAMAWLAVIFVRDGIGKPLASIVAPPK